MNRPLVVIGSGAVTAVGLSSAQTCASVRASVSGFGLWDLSHLSLDLAPAKAAFAPLRRPPRDNQLFARLVDMAASAIQETLATSEVAPARTALFLGVREPYRSHPDLDGRNEELVLAIERALNVRFHRESRVISQGKPSALVALASARELLIAGRVEACIVGGVDSLVNWYDFRRFSETFRLQMDDVAQSGFIPGEGAAFVAVAARDQASGQGLGEILGVGWADEDPSVTVLSNGHPTGKGLHRALEATAQDASVPEAVIDFRVSDLNGEYYRGIESMLAAARFYRTRREDAVAWIPASCVGDIGAAFGALLIIMAVVGMAKGYAPGPIAMCETSSDTGLSAGCLVRASTFSRTS
jgi:3-oxoacyl-[acyl-carrier-protein] synthase I